MALDFPKTAEVWDKDTSYEDVFKQIMEFLDGKSKIKILAPGAGHGRCLIHFLREIANRMPDAQVSFVAVEPDELAVRKLHDKLVEEKFTNIKYKIAQTTLEEYLTKNKSHFDLIICLLFFHYVSHCWISLLSGLLKLLKKDGILVFDEIIGKTKDDQLILNYIDCDFAKLHSKEKPGSDKTEHLRNFFRQFYNYLLREESIIWSSSVKGTNVEKIVHALKPLFKINNDPIPAYRASSLEINILDAIKNKEHLPFWYGTMVNANFERVSNKIEKSDQMLSYLKKCELSVGFNFYIFAKKKSFSDDFLVRHWDATKNKTILDSLHMINSVLPQVSEFGTVTFSSHNLYVHNLQMAAIRLLLTSGVFRWDTKINSIFVVQGKLTQTLRTPKLSKLVILTRYSPQPEDRDVLLLSWLINYALYARVLNTSLSEKFIASGEMVEITMDDGIEELQIFEQEYNGQSKIRIRIPTEIKVDINYRENKLKTPTAEIPINPEKLINENILDKVRRLIWHDVIELDRKGKIPDGIMGLARFVVENVPSVKISTEDGKLLESYFYSKEPKESKEIIRYLGILLGNVGSTIIFIPIPTVYSIDSHKYESLIGVGIVVQGKIDSKDDDNECKYIRSILTLFFRAFQEAYLGLHWVEVSRRHAMRSAVAAIMGRNMSHNLGSHVLANIVQMEDDSLDKKKAKNLFGFLQQRMDLIAQISTTAPTWTFDMKLGDMIDRFNDQKYLGEFIAKFRGLGSEEINVFLANPSRDKAKEIAIPTATIGCHAVFSIMENIIRNAARHGMRNGQGTLDLSIDVDDNHWRFYKLTIKDNCDNGDKASELNSKLESSIIDKSGQLKTEAWGMKEKKILACYLRLIAQENVDEKYRLFLTNPETSDEPPIIKADNNKDGNLAYALFLLKAKKVLVVSDKEKGNDEFKKAGIDFMDVAEFEKMDRGKIIHKFLVVDIRNITDPATWIEENIINDINRLPFRILVVGNISSLERALPQNVIRCSSCSETGDIVEPGKFYEEIWNKWVSFFYSDYKLAVRITGILLPSNLNVLEDKCDYLNSTEKYVLLDHKKESDNSKLYTAVACHIPFDTSGGTIYEIVKKTDEESYLIGQLIEMGATTIAIVDDRIWKTRNKIVNVEKYKIESSKEILSLWERKGVDICDVDCAINDFEQFVENFPKQKYQFLIFHQGEIDEIKKRTGDKFKQLWKILKNRVLCTVIDTGRGVPEQALEDNLRWVPYSLLQECIIEKAGHSLAKKRLVDLLVTLKAEKSNE